MRSSCSYYTLYSPLPQFILQGYHWFGNAETYFYIGTAMGEAMKHELAGTWKQPYINTTVPHKAVDEGFNGC
jgi:hypothetical protein